MKKIYIISSIIFLLALIFIFFYLALFKPSGQDLSLNIKQGDGTREIAQKLKNGKAIFSPMLFSFYIYQRHWYLQSGVYEIKKSMSPLEIAELLRKGDVKEYLVTIPEGWRVTQIDELLTSKNIIKKGELLSIASSEEGRLFPDTYRFSLDITPAQIKNIMLENFSKKTADLESNTKVTQEALIIASIVEREAKFDEDRAKIAGVYWSRLDKGMRLEADPTIQYGKGSWDPITVSDYKNFYSSYNTYLNDGLPPGPICNPGIKSIEAALFPQKDGSLFFFHKDDGHAVYSKTLQEHRANLGKE